MLFFIKGCSNHNISFEIEEYCLTAAHTLTTKPGNTTVKISVTKKTSMEIKYLIGGFLIKKETKLDSFNLNTA